MSANIGVSATIKNEPMHRVQFFVVAICVLISAIDGFDISAISFAASGIAEEYNISRGGYLGTILSAELLGMALGSLFLGRIADSVGRVPILIVGTVIVSLGMFAVYLTSTSVQLLICRVITGVGIGGLLATSTALVSEFSNERNRALCILLMTSGLPFGAVIGGVALNFFGVNVIEEWRTIFLAGAMVTVLVLPLIIIFVPESVEFIENRQPERALERINSTLKKIGHGPIEQFSVGKTTQSTAGFSALFSEAHMARKTVLLTVAFFAHMLTFYFFLKWIPKLVFDAGFEGAGVTVLVWANIGGIIGGIVAAFVSRKMNIWLLLIVCQLGTFLVVGYFGQVTGSLDALKIVAATAVFFAFPAIALLYTLFTIVFPPTSRAGGTGFVIGMGRGGAILAPIIGGMLLGFNIDESVVVAIMGSGCLVSLMALIALRKSSEITA